MIILIGAFGIQVSNVLSSMLLQNGVVIDQKFDLFIASIGYFFAATIQIMFIFILIRYFLNQLITNYINNKPVDLNFIFKNLLILLVGSTLFFYAIEFLFKITIGFTEF